jgi:hypothetical protein
LESVRWHLDHCEECSSKLAAERSLDRKLACSIQAVEIPVDLERRLVERCLANLPTVASQPKIGPAASRRRWSLSAAALAVFVCLGLVALRSRPARLTLEDLEGLARWTNSNVSSAPVDLRDRPAGWQQISVHERSTQRVRTVDLISFQWKPHRASGVSGRLWIVPASRIVGAAKLPDLSTAEIQYRATSAHLVWQEGGVVYLLELGDDVGGLEQLRKALVQARAVA